MIHLNVGGTRFDTTVETLKPCKRLQQYMKEGNDVFIDRDPQVFRRTLMVLRGYPCDEVVVKDLDVIADLTWLEHQFLEIKLPDWLENAVRPVETSDTNHALDPEQTARFSRTRVLVASDAVAQLHNIGVLDGGRTYPKCRVVGVKEGWVDSLWVPTQDFQLAKLKLKFIKHFLPHREVREVREEREVALSSDT